MSDSNSQSIEPVGIVGLGNMGLALAERVSKRFRVIGTDLLAERRSLAERAGIGVGELADVARACKIVLLSLPNPKASLAVAREIAAHRASVAIVVETSTVTPADARAVEQVLVAAGVAMAGAAILSGVAQMRAGTTSLLLGGDASTLDAIAPLLDAITPNHRALGTISAAMAAKVVNNAVAHAVMVLLAEAMAMAKTAGLDPAEMVSILKKSDGGLVRPLTHRIAERAFSGNYAGGMPLEAARKDSILAQAMAQDAGVPIFTIPAAHAVYEMAIAHGWARDDYASLVKLWEEWCKVSFVANASSEKSPLLKQAS